MSTIDDTSFTMNPVESGEYKAPISSKWTGWVIAGGVVLPLLTYLFEMATRLCTNFFDPIPTIWHILFLFAVPLANLAAVIAFRRGDLRYSVVLAAFLGVGTGVAFVYSVLLLPILPFGLIALLAYGFGLLMLSPFIALVCSCVTTRNLLNICPDGAKKHKKAFWGGLLSAVLVLVGFVASIEVTHIGLRDAASNNEAKSKRGVQLIRTFGNKSALLRACYELPSGVWAFGIFDGRGPMDKEQARNVYYRVTGKPFNSVAPPRLAGFRTRVADDVEVDSDVGGTAVNGAVPGLSMTSSRMDAVVEPDAMTAYTEWTLIFSNSTSTAKEARAEIALPPGAAVSRLTLWVNGEEREAAFSTRGKVREAYQEVAVVQRRDPVLVTTCGDDRVLMQCFPVPPDGKTMKIRLGITSPLMARGYSKGLLVLPRFAEKNFEIADGVEHSLFIESPRDTVFAGDKTKVLRAQITNAQLGGEKSLIICERNREIKTVWTPDMLEPMKYAVVQTLSPSSEIAPKKVVIVIDGSVSMADIGEEIAGAIGKLPADCQFAVIQAGDDVGQLTPMQAVSRESIDNAADQIKRIRFAGGIDNRDALLKASDMTSKGGVIVWVHGPQPLTNDAKSEQLMQVWQRRRHTFKIYSIAAAEGRNSILTEMEQTGAVVAVPRVETVSEDIGRLCDSWKGREQSIAPNWKRVRLRDAQGARVSAHIARLWARAEVLRICRMGDSRLLYDASMFAARHQIVTSVSGAVVLENEEQYRRAGLKSVDPKTVPSTVPEPATLVSLAVGLASLAAVGYRRRRTL